MSADQKARDVAEIVSDAGGTVIGRTRLQKIGYLLTATGLDDNFSFVYKHYGPYSEELASSAKAAQFMGILQEVESPASWGGTYSSYRSLLERGAPVEQSRGELARTAAAADAVELELAATAAFLSIEGHPDPWLETSRRKPEKSENGRIEKAKSLYKTLQAINTPIRLPAI